MFWRADRTAGWAFLLTALTWLPSGCAGNGADETETPGLRVERVESWGAAAGLGIEAGDVVESWSSATAGGAASDPLELLWLEYDAAPRGPVILTVRGGPGLEAKAFADSGWEMTVRPALPPVAMAAYDRARAPGEYRPATWDELERLVAGAVPAAAVWAAWRHAVTAAAFPDRAEEASRAFQRARDLAAGRPEIVALLHVEEAQTLWLATQYDKADAPLAAATAALRQLDPASPLLGLSLERESRQLVWRRRLEDARRALAEAEKNLEAHPRARALEVALLARRAAIEYKAGNLELSEAAYRSALALADRRGDPYVEQIGLDLGNVLKDQGEYEEAGEWYRRSLTLTTATPRERIALAAANNNLGLLSKLLGNFDRAESHYLRALEFFPAGGAAEAGIRNNLGNLAMRRGDLARAADYHRAALGLRLAIQPDSSAVASSYHNLAIVLRLEGRPGEAAPMLAKALAIKADKVPDSLLMASTLEESGLNELALGDVESASEHLSRACEISRTLAPDSFDHGRCTLYLGDVALATGDRERASGLWRQGLGIIEKLRTRVPSEQGKARFSAMFDDYYRKLAAGYLEDGDAARALLTLESARARMLRALLQQFGDRAALASSPKLLEARRRTDSSIERTLGRLARLHPVADAEQVRELHQRLQSLQSEREEINENLYRSADGLERIERIPPISIERIRRHLPGDSVGLLYALGERHSQVFVVRPGGEGPGVEAVPLAVGREDVARRIDIFRSLLERGRDVAALEPAVVEQGRRLYDDLLAPVAKHLSSASRLYVAPDAALAGLPFAALIRSREPLTFVAEWLPHAVVPSLSSLVELRHGVRPHGVRPHGVRSYGVRPYGVRPYGVHPYGPAGQPRPELELVAFGAPDLSRTAASERARGLGRLPGAKQEIRALVQLFGNRALALVGPQATEAAVRAALPRGRYVHFATHALLDRRFPMSSSLVLSAGAIDAGERDDGLLHGWEMLEIPALAAELVTLAGCETGRGAEWEGEGLIGLAQAFHYVGTPAVLASQWRVGDDWVGELTAVLYRELLAGRDPMHALAAAQRRMIASAPAPNGAAMSHPFYWAAFTLFGVGG